MRKINTSPVYVYLSVAFFYTSSFTIALMPLGVLSAFLAIVFWLGIVLGVVFTFIAAKQRRWDKKYVDSGGGRLPGLLRFFSTPTAVVFDILLIVGIGMFIVTNFFIQLPDWMIWELIFFTVFSLEMHCVFNGKNYRWIRAKRAEGSR